MKRFYVTVFCVLAVVVQPIILPRLAMIASQEKGTMQPNRPNQAGVIEDFDFQSIDDLLRLGNLKVRMVIFRKRSETEVSSAHLSVFRKWVGDGGVAYFFSNALFGSLFNKLDAASVTSVRVMKESGAEFQAAKENCVGELFVRDAVPAVRLLDHRITGGITSLYVCGERADTVYYFSAKEPASFRPILQLSGFHSSDWFGINKQHPNYATVTITLFGVVELGRGLIVCDGTGLMIGGNSFRGNAYDWPIMRKNILDYDSTSR